MKNSTLLLFILILVLNVQSAMAQCPTCVPDETCVSTNSLPTVCPLIQPNGIAGVYYEEQMTFYMPADVVEPGSGIEATLLEVEIVSVTGLPYGLTFALNDEDAIYHPVDGENFGCATVCGTPLLPGTYTVVISVVALAEALGFEVTQGETFYSTLVVDPGEGSLNSFSYDNIAACGGLEVNYAALIEVPSPSVVTYDWDFGNGQTSDDQIPNTVTYDSYGDFTAELTTTVYDWVLHSVSVSNVSNNWDGDIDDIISTADPYFYLIDGDGNIVYTSSTIDNTTNTSWQSLQFMLSNPPYHIQFYDEDDISEDDDLGSFEVGLDAGENFFDTGSGTVGLTNISLDQTNQFVDSLTVTVFGVPDASMFQDGNTLYFTDPTLESFIWFQNGVAIDNATDSSLVLTEGGQYYAEVANEFGCSATSQTILYCPEIQVAFDQAAMEVSVEDVYESYQWYFNGLAVDNANNSYLTVINSGNYAVEITTSYGCETMSNVLTLTVQVEESLAKAPVVYPNPTDQFLFINGNSKGNMQKINVYDLTGRITFTAIPQNNGGQISIDVSELAPGIYFAEINQQQIRFIRR